MYTADPQEKFYSTLLKIAFPIAFQHLVIFGLALIDMVMIGQLGKTSLAGVAIAVQFHFILILFHFGIASGTSVFTAQFFGKGDIPSIHKVMGIGVIGAQIGSLVFFLIAFFRPNWVFSIYTIDPLVTAEGITYLRVTAWGFFFTGVIIPYSHVLKSVRIVILPLIATSISLGLNTFLNWVLIFGHLGFEPMGVKGAAIATVISRGLDVLILISVIYYLKMPLAAPIKQLFSFNMKLFKEVNYTALPVLLNEIGWGTGVAIFGVIYARMGTEAMASWSICEQAMNCAMIIIFGTCHACTVMIGNQLGAGNLKTAESHAEKFIKVSIISGAIAGVVIYLFADVIPQLFNVSVSIQANATLIFKVFALIIIFKSMNFHLIVGVLRGGGDTHFGMIADIGFVWGIGIPMAAYAAFVLHLPVHLVYLAASTEEILKLFAAFYRYKQKYWLKNLTYVTEKI